MIKDQQIKDLLNTLRFLVGMVLSLLKNLDGVGGLSISGAAHKVQTTVLPDNKAFIPSGSAVSNATGTDDTAVKLNALIASLKAVNYIA